MATRKSPRIKQSNVSKICPKSNSDDWNYFEKKAFVAAVQRYGMSDISKIAEMVKTKDEHAIKSFILKRTQKREIELRKKESGDHVPTRFIDKNTGNINPNFPPLRCWKRIITNQMSQASKHADYSNVFIELFEKFYEEEEEIDVPHLPNFKAIYKFIVDMSKDEVPALLKPIDAAILLILIQDIKGIIQSSDLRHEKYFTSLQNITKFVLAGDEDKDQDQKDDSNEVAVPMEIFTHLARHKKIKECLNPLNVPLGLLEKEQSLLKNFPYPPPT